MKKVFIPLMLCAAAFVSCSKDDVEDGVGTTSSSDLVSINVSSGTTRGTDTTTQTLEEDKEVKLFIFDSDDEDGDVDNYSYTFTYDESSGEWVDSNIAWSTIEFPATFLSMHDGDTQNLDVTTSTEIATLAYKVSGTTYDHKDLVYHASKLSAIPTGGTVNAYHKHALSKIHLYAATGGNKVYIARVQFVNVNNEGTVTINAVNATDAYTATGVSWDNEESTCSYVYFHIDTYEGDDYEADDFVAGAYADNASLRVSTTDGSLIINDDAGAPFMMIPQKTTPITSDNIANGKLTEGSYIEVIYYMTDTDDTPLVGYSGLAAYPNASKYVEKDPDEPMYVMGAFPVDYTFDPNKEYDITLGLGKTGSTGGLLLVDYYVDKDGDPVELTLLDDDDDDDDENDETETPEIPEIDPGDDIFADGNDFICVTVSAYDWDDGDDTSVGYSE